MTSMYLRKEFHLSVLPLLTFPLILLLQEPALAATETYVAGGAPTTVNLLVSGDDVALTGQGPEITLNVPDGFTLGISGGGDSVTSQAAINTGRVTFLGNSLVLGRIGGGANSQVFSRISGGVAGTTVTFNGPISANEIDFTSGSTMVFNNITSGALHYNTFNGNAILGSGAVFNGAATTLAPNVGLLTVNSGSSYVGAVGDPTNFLNTITLNGNASITGAIASQSYVLGPNTLTQVGSVTFPAAAQLTLDVLSDTVFGRINAPGSAINFTTGLQVNVHVTDSVVLSGVPLQVVTGTSGTFGPSSAPITTTSNNPRFSFIGLNPAGTGNVLLFPTVVPAILPNPIAGGAASAFDAGAIGATGDFLYVQQLVSALRDLRAIGDAEAQFAPIVNNGNSFMTFQAINQFQSMWASNLSKARAADMCYPKADPCNPCDPNNSTDSTCLSSCNTSCNPCNRDGKTEWNGEGLWIDGFGYTGKQRTRMEIPGYDAKMYGAMIAVQRPLSDNFQVGLGAGYAYSDIDGKGVQQNGTKIETPQTTLYLGYNCDSWFLDNFFTYAWNHYKGHRRILFPGLDRIAKARYHGQAYGALFSGGYNFFFDTGITITPLASLQYLHQRIDGYTEKGAISLNLIQRSQHYKVTQGAAGLMVGYNYGIDCGVLYNEVHSRYLHDFKHYRIKNSSRFLGSVIAPEFETLGVRSPRDQVNVGFSSTLFTTCDWAFKASYELNYRKKYMSHEGRATVTYIF